MRIVYLADSHIPSRATNAMQIMRMCAAFAAQGADVSLVRPFRFGNRPEGYAGDVWAFYGLPESFRMITLPTPLSLQLSNFKRFARLARGLPLAAWMLGRSRPTAEPFTAYCRSMLGARIALVVRGLWGARSACHEVYVEVHDAPSTDEAWKTLARADGVVAISAALGDHLIAACPSLADRVSVEHDGVDGTPVQSPGLAAESVRRRLGIDQRSTVVGYTGRVNTGKGLDTLVRAAELLESAPVHFLVVGKVYEDVDVQAASRAGNVTFTGFIPPADVAPFVAAADILVMPTSARLPYSRFTSPLKLFEYLASGKPVICSNLPVLREVVENRVNALLFEADSGDSLAAAILELSADPEMARRIAEKARETASYYSWNNRAARILRRLNRS